MPPKKLVSKPTETLFRADEILPSWRDEWQGMPEFVQDKIEPYATITVRFANKDDLAEFAELVNQRLTNRTKSIWYPELVRGKHANKRYRDES